MTRRPLDLAIGIAVIAVAAVGIADALRGDGHEPPAAERAPAATDAALREASVRLRDAGVEGTLVYADRDCWLRSVRLPELRRLPRPEGPERACAFALSPDGRRVTSASARWATSAFYARCTGNAVDVHYWPGLRPLLRYAGCVPAWRPGTPPMLTLVRDGAVLEVAPGCEGQPPCERVVVPEATILAAAATHPNVPFANHEALERVRVVDAAWLSRTRIALLLRLLIRGVGDQDLVAVLENGRVRGSYYFFDTDRDGIEPAPGGTQAWAGGAFAFTAAGPRLAVPDAFGPIRAAAWSPDGEWLALAARGAVAFVRHGTESEARVVTVPLDAADIGWAPR